VGRGAPDHGGFGKARVPVLTDGGRGVVDPELGGEFLGDPLPAPLGMVPGDPSDEVDVLAGDSGSADLGRA